MAEDLQSTLASIPGLSGYIAMGQYLRQKQQQAVADQAAESFRKERAAIPTGSPASAYTGLALRYGGPQEVLKYGDDLQKLEDAKALRAETAGMLSKINQMGAQPAPSAQTPDTGLTEPPGAVPAAGVNDSRIAQLRAMSEIPQVANNPAALTSIQREIDRLSAPKQERNPLIQMLPISATHEQPHISMDNGVTFNPIPGSAPRPIFNPSAAIDPGVIEKNAKAIYEYRMAPITGFGLRSPGGAQTMARVNELGEEAGKPYDAKEFSNRLMGERGFLAKQGQAIRGFNVVIDHLDTAQTLFDALKGGNIQTVNAARAAFQKEFGQAAPTSLNAAKQFIAAEAVRAVTGAAGALGDREEMAKNLSTKLSDEQFLGTVDTIKKLAIGQLQGNEQQYRSVTGNKEDFKSRFLTPGSRSAWEKYGKKQDQSGAFSDAEKERRYQEWKAGQGG